MNDFWQHCSALLERELTPQQYVTWIKPLAPVAFDASANTLSIAAPNRFKLDWVKSQFSGRIYTSDLTLVDARTIGVQPWEKNMVAKVEKAIREADLGLNPATAGDLIRVPMPALTEERRRELTKVVKSEGETAKVAIRNLRRDANEALKKLVKDKEISEDDERRASDDVQKLTDKHVAEIDKLVQSKEAEIMTV